MCIRDSDKCADAVDDKQDAERNVKAVARNGSGKLQCGAAEPVAECGLFALSLIHIFGTAS